MFQFLRRWWEKLRSVRLIEVPMGAYEVIDIPTILEVNEMPVDGYVVEAEGVGFLTKYMFWYEHPTIQTAWVHPPEILQRLRAVVDEWEVQPTRVYPARYEPGTGTVITAEPFPFE